MHTERFAPSPTGYLHLGHAFSVLTAWNSACHAGGNLLLRIEDIDPARSRPEYESSILEDLEWLGIKWQPPIIRQSERLELYEDALTRLSALGLCYPCGCTRRDIQNALTAPHAETNSVSSQDLGMAAAYPGTCRCRPMNGRTKQDAVRLDMKRAIDLLGGSVSIQHISFKEFGCTYKGHHRLDSEWLLGSVGDIVLARKDVGTSYHLAVVVDDADQGVTHVTRGEDLFEFTQIHRLLQELLGLPVPVWIHHPLVRNQAGQRLAKRNDVRSLRAYRAQGMCREDIMALLDRFC